MVDPPAARGERRQLAQARRLRRARRVNRAAAASEVGAELEAVAVDAAADGTMGMDDDDDDDGDELGIARMSGERGGRRRGRGGQEEEEEEEEEEGEDGDESEADNAVKGVGRSPTETPSSFSTERRRRMPAAPVARRRPRAERRGGLRAADAPRGCTPSLRRRWPRRKRHKSRGAPPRARPGLDLDLIVRPSPTAPPPRCE